MPLNIGSSRSNPISLLRLASQVCSIIGVIKQMIQSKDTMKRKITGLFALEFIVNL